MSTAIAIKAVMTFNSLKRETIPQIHTHITKRFTYARTTWVGSRSSGSIWFFFSFITIAYSDCCCLFIWTGDVASPPQYQILLNPLLRPSELLQSESPLALHGSDMCKNRRERVLFSSETRREFWRLSLGFAISLGGADCGSLRTAGDLGSGELTWVDDGA